MAAFYIVLSVAVVVSRYMYVLLPENYIKSLYIFYSVVSNNCVYKIYGEEFPLAPTLYFVTPKWNMPPTKWGLFNPQLGVVFSF